MTELLRVLWRTANGLVFIAAIIVAAHLVLLPAFLAGAQDSLWWFAAYVPGLLVLGYLVGDIT